MLDRNILVGSYYQHYKGGYYWVEGVGEHTETGEQLVIYRAVQRERGKDILLHSKTWIRPERMFLDTVEIGTELKLRFTPVSKNSIPFNDE